MVENRVIEDEMTSAYGTHDSMDPYIQGTEALDRPEYMFAGLYGLYRIIECDCAIGLGTRFLFHRL